MIIEPAQAIKKFVNRQVRILEIIVSKNYYTNVSVENDKCKTQLKIL